MSLLTQADTIPWAESIRLELLAGHMPPWRVEGRPERFRNTSGLTPRELDVLLTWVTGGTPVGNVDKSPRPVARTNVWALGDPDRVVQLPAVTLPASLRDETREFTVRLDTHEASWLRAVDLMPGTPAIVRSATISVRTDVSDMPAGSVDHVLGLWQPGDDPVALERGLGFRLPVTAALKVRVHYKKNWRDRQRAMSDQSRIAIYFAPESSAEVTAITLRLASTSDTGVNNPSAARHSFTQIVDRDVRVLAIYPDPALPQARIRVTAATPDGSRTELIALRARPGWARRYWFTEPVDLSRGTVLEVTSQPDDTLLAPDAPRFPVASINPSSVSLTLDVTSR